MITFLFNTTASTEIYTLSLHDALPICVRARLPHPHRARQFSARGHHLRPQHLDRKSTRLNSSHQIISYAVFCLKKKSNAGETDRDANTHIQLRACYDTSTCYCRSSSIN